LVEPKMKRDANIHPEWPTDSTDKTPAGTADSAKSPCLTGLRRWR
jgi:hypothetical protein